MIRSNTHKLEQVLTNVMDNIAQGVVMYDSAKRLVIWNDQYQDILQFPDGMLRPGVSNWELANFLAKRGDFGAGDPTTLTNDRLETLWGGYTSQSVLKICGQKSYDVRFIRTPDFGLVITYTDITEEIENKTEIQIQRDALEDLNQHKDQLFSIIGHDLKNPFGIVITYSDLLLMETKEAYPHDSLNKMSEYAHSINDGAKAANALLDNLLNWARKHVNHQPFSPTNQRLEPILDQAIEIYNSDIKYKNIDIRREKTTAMVLVDVDMISTVVRNLIGNAIKFSHSGGTVTVDVLEQKDRIDILIKDEGVGISNTNILSLNQLNSLDSTPGTNGETGSGFGLSVAMDFVSKHNGTIRIESEMGKGTTFCVTLPKN